MSDSPQREPLLPHAGHMAPGVRPKNGGRQGAYAGFCGAVGMAIIAAICAGIYEAFDNEPGNVGDAIFFFLMFGFFFAAIFGSIAGSIFGSVLAALERTSSGPVVGLLAPFVVIVPLSLAWAALDGGSELLKAAALSFGFAGLFAPAGYLAGKLYLREMTTLTR